MSEKYDITIMDGIKGAKPRKIATKNKNREGSWFYLGIVGQIGYVIAIPLVVGVVVGKMVNHVLIGLAVGFVISVAGFIRVLREAIKK